MVSKLANIFILVSLVAAQCPQSDNSGVPLSNSQSDSNFVTCAFQGGAGLCEYFPKTGEFLFGSSDCPSSISVSNSSIINANATTTGIPCLLSDKESSPLTESSSDGNSLTCTYQNAGVCDYSPAGPLLSGSTSCPDGLAQFQTNSSTNSSCPSSDNSNSPLISSGTDESFVTCTYQSARLCEYFQDGSFSSGSSICPSSILINGSGNSTQLDGSQSSSSSSTATPTSTGSGNTITASSTTSTPTSIQSGFITSFSLAPVPTLGSSSNSKSSAVSLTVSQAKLSLGIVLVIALGFSLL